MTEPPQPDLLDQAGRLRRIAVALAVGIAVAVITYFIATALIEPEHQPHSTYVNRNMDASTFVYWVSGVAGACGLMIAGVIGAALARRKAERERIPKATVR